MRRVVTATFLRVWKRARWRHLQAMTKDQWLDRESLQRWHDAKLTATLRHAVAHVPRYRDLASARGWRTESLCHEHLAEFPLVDKPTLTAGQAQYLAEDARTADRLASVTGGSTGVLFRFFGDWRSREYRQACDLLGRTWTGWRVGEPQAVLWGHSRDLEASRRFRARLNNAMLHRSLTLNVFEMDKAALQHFYVRLRAHNPRIILGYASALAFVAESMREQDVTGVQPRGIISAAEFLGDEQRAVIEEQFTCRVLNRYGSREFGTVAQQCERVGGFHVFIDRVHVELLRPDGTPCAPGERGEITVTDLTNRIMPFIRYRTGDLAIATADSCPCGRHSPLIARVEGRVSELIVGINGRLFACPGPTFWTKGVQGVRQLQIYQPDRESIEARVVPGPQWGEEPARLLTARFRELLGPMRVTIVLRDEIPVSASGKYRFAISNASPFNRRS